VYLILNVRREVNIYEGKAVEVKERQYTGPSGKVRARTYIITR
jgi:hypothetical protein